MKPPGVRRAVPARYREYPSCLLVLVVVVVVFVGDDDVAAVMVAIMEFVSGAVRWSGFWFEIHRMQKNNSSQYNKRNCFTDP